MLEIIKSHQLIVVINILLIKIYFRLLINSLFIIINIHVCYHPINNMHNNMPYKMYCHATLVCYCPAKGVPLWSL